MKKFILSALVLAAFLAYSVHLKADEDEHPLVAIRLTSTPTPTPALAPAVPILGSPAPSPISTPKPKGRYNDGNFTGNVTDAFYGNLQVSVTVTGGKISDVKFLQYPNDRRTSVEINTQAMPLLRQEAIIAQSAKVDGVSGATQTSAAFIKSLQSALDKAV